MENYLSDEDVPLLVPTKVEEVKKYQRCYLPRRYIMVFLMMMGFFNFFGLRTIFNMSLLAMVNLTETSTVNSSTFKCAEHNVWNHTLAPQKGEFNWDPTLQGVLLGAFYYGYPVSQLPSGYIAERFGGRFIFAFIGLSNGLLSLLMPLMAGFSPYALLAVRALQGFFQGPIYPTCFAMLSRWNPPGERTTMYAITNAGATFGAFTGLAVGGVLAQQTFLKGWPLPFYLFGILSIVWSIVWMFLVYDTPAVHPSISAQERMYIEKETEDLDNVVYTHPPWCSLLKSVPVWACAFVLLTDCFGFYVIFNSMPIYMKQVLGFDLTGDGLVNALPYIVQVPMTLTAGWTADYIRRKNCIRLVNIRRVYEIIGQVSPGVCLLALAFTGCDKTLAVGLLIVGVALNGFNTVGHANSLFDIAPLYAGSILGIINGIANVGGFISPAVVSAIAGDSRDQSKWQLVFFLACGIYLIGVLVYIIFITDKEATWAKEKRANKRRNTNQKIEDEDIE